MIPPTIGPKIADTESIILLMEFIFISILCVTTLGLAASIATPKKVVKTVSRKVAA